MTPIDLSPVSNHDDDSSSSSYDVRTNIATKLSRGKKKTLNAASKLSRVINNKRHFSDLDYSDQKENKKPRLLLTKTGSGSLEKKKMSSFHHSHSMHPHPQLAMNNGYSKGNPESSHSAVQTAVTSSNNKYASSSSSLSGGTGHTNSNNSTSGSSKTPSIASLCNLGNTCFLNSVLYTLRFTPGFIHNLHHMVYDLSQHNKASNNSSSTNGNNGKSKKGNILTNGFTNGFSNGHHQQDSDSEGEMVQEVIEQLHDLFRTLSVADESSDSGRDPIPPSSFLKAVGRINPTFDGNQQQDAHELLVTIINLLEDIKIPAAVTLPTALNNITGSENVEKNDLNSLDKKSSKIKKSLLKQNGLTTSNGNAIKEKKTILPISSVATATSSNPASTGAPAPLTPVMLPNFVRENFEGKSVMRTRCLECEMSTYQSEAFTFIDVPLHLDEEDEELGGKELFLKQILMSETLRENNKYWCEECSRLNEAQRSVEYEILPKVMVLQLKRFTATGSKYMSKINDYIPTPFHLNCFCRQCMPSSAAARKQQQQHPQKPKHHFRLYSVIMHLGATLASGHYIAYVRASPEVTWEYNQCQRVSTVERNKNKKGIMKFLVRKKDDSSKSSSSNSNGESSVNNGGVDLNLGSCRSASCCGIRGGLAAAAANNSSSFDSLGSSPSLINQRSTESCTDSSSPDISSSCSGPDSDHWLECDDESIQLISRKQFEDVLSAKQGATTPYLLFYQKI